MIKIQVGKNASKFWKDTVGNVSSGITLNQAKGIKNILKLTKIGIGNFNKLATSGDFNIISMDIIKDKIKDTYLSFDSTAKISEATKNINDIKDNIGKISGSMDNIMAAPVF